MLYSIFKVTGPRLTDFVNYVKDTWVESSLWPPSSWSVSNLAVRTNNDIEGWHHSLNRQASGRWNLPFYVFIHLLFKEAQMTIINIRLVSDRKLKRIQRKVYKKLQSKLFGYWEEYENGQKNAKQLLKCCSLLNGPRAD